MASYRIDVKRGSSSGLLTFNAGGVSVSTTCWWDPQHVIVADDYPSYRTHMASKKDSVTGQKRPGIWLGKDVPYGDGSRKSNGIFIHEGRNASWSDGCIVCVRSEFIRIWNAIQPDGSANVLVSVTDDATS